MRKVALAIFCVLVAATAGSVWWYHYTGTPQYSLLSLAKAVKAKDYETARYFVDDERMSDTISRSLVETITDRMSKEMQKDRNPFSGFGVAMIQMMAPKMREMAKDQVKDSIKQALSGNDTLTNKAGTKQADLKSFSNLTIQQSVVSGNTAEVLLVGVPQPNPFGLKEVRLRMAKIPNTRSWRIVEVPDAGQVFAKMFDEAQLTTAGNQRTGTPN